jgi:hypothetical protein
MSDAPTADEKSMALNMRDYVGQTVMGRYRLIRYLSEGGFGAVYQASHEAYELQLREVAVKLGKRPMEDREARDIFRDALEMVRVAEYTADPLLRQKFVRVYDAGRCPDTGPLAGHPFVAMEFVHGGSIRTCLRAGAFPLKRAVNYFDQMLDAVAFMHTGIAGPDGSPRPLIHRDIKPDNVLVERRSDGGDVVKMTDFGLAVEVDALLGWTHSSGDLAYLPPESFTHNICSPQSDVYMLALVFYEMITGHSPFAEVGCHLREEDNEKATRVRDIHQQARKHETFALLEQHEELKCGENRALASVIRAALAQKMSDRPFLNASQFKEAWHAAKFGTGAPAVEKPPWVLVEELTDEAGQCAVAMNRTQGRDCINRAMGINRTLADRMQVGRTYLLMTRWLLQDGDHAEAGKVAAEGYRRRRCRSTCEAMAAYYQAVNPKMAVRYSSEAGRCGDKS